MRTGGVDYILHDLLIIEPLALLNQCASTFSANSAAVLSGLGVLRF